MDNKTIIEKIAKELQVGAETVSDLVEGLVNVLGECAADMDSVTLAGLGTFEPKKRLERIALHPATGKRLLVPPKLMLSFRPSTTLKQKIRNGK